jgi:hypothetical protein
VAYQPLKTELPQKVWLGLRGSWLSWLPRKLGAGAVTAGGLRLVRVGDEAYFCFS